MKASQMKLMILTLALILVQNLFAGVMEQESFLSNHLTDVIKSYDARGVVRVDIELRDKNLELPGTNFLVSSNVLGELNKKNVKNITVNVFTQLEDMPEEFKAYIDNKTKKYTKASNIKFIQLEKTESGVEGSISNGLDKLTAKLGSNDNLIYVLATIPFAIFIIAFLFKGQLGKATNMMGAELQGLTSALQEQGIGTTPEAVALEGMGKFDSSGSEQSSTVLEQSMWEVMNEEFYIGLISDCYWCLEDKYASFVWSKVPVELKRQLISEEKVDESYIKYISDLKPEDKAFGNNSYYLKPWGYSHISNEDLSKLIKEDKRLFGFLSPMRLTKMDLTLEEKLECVTASSGNSAMKESFFIQKIENISPSDRREFESSIEFAFADFDEENRLVEMDVAFKIMKKFPTLGWALRLSDEKVIEILSSFQARDLAGALFTSEEIRTKLLSKMPEKRRELIESYVQKAKPMKNNTYSAIMKLVYNELEELNLSEHNKEEAQSA